MYDFDFDPETNGIVLQESEKPLRREIRPVYCHELDMLGLKDRWRYPSDDSAPVMWAINQFYFYKGRKVMKTQGGSCYSAPVVTVLEDPEPAGVLLQMCDIAGMSARNKPLLVQIRWDYL